MADEFHESGDLDEGRIKDPLVAHDLANKVQAGWEKALAAERVLTEKLTNEQKEQLRIVESLPGRYPHAFVPDEDGTPIRVGGETGLQYLLTRPDKNSGAVIVLSQYGYAFVTREGVFTDRELSETDFSAVFVDSGKHKRQGLKDYELIEFSVMGGVANYQVHGKGQVTAENAPRLKDLLVEREKEGLAWDAEKKKGRVDVLSLL